MKNVVVEGCTISLSAGIGDKNIQSNPVQTGNVDGKKIYTGTMLVSISNYIDRQIGLTGGVGVAVINGSASYITYDGLPVLLEGDKDDKCMITGVVGNTPTTVPISVTISKAGQDIFAGE